jgi:hypothetical protein
MDVNIVHDPVSCLIRRLDVESAGVAWEGNPPAVERLFLVILGKSNVEIVWATRLLCTTMLVA